MTEQRKKLMVGVIAVLGCLLIADQLWSRMVVVPREASQKKIDAISKQIQKTKRLLRRAKKRAAMLKDMRQRSLPADVQTARTLYQSWLHELVDRVDLQERSVNSESPSSRPGYDLLPFTVRGEGTMEQLTRFLFDFYRAPHLHRLRTMSISPIGTGARLDLSFSIEAIIVEGCGRKDRLATGVATTLASDNLRDYRILVERNLFGRNPQADVTELTELTAVVAVDGASQAWFMNRIEDSLQKLRVGERLRAGWFNGVVLEINGNDVILEVDGARWLMTRGDRLADAVAVPPEF